MKTDKILSELCAIRRRLDSAFSQASAYPTVNALAVGSAGQCGATALLIQHLFGGDLVSTNIGKDSHWYNRLNVEGTQIDVDITGDQYGYEPVRVGPVGTLFRQSRIRSTSEVQSETRIRAAVLARNSGFPFPDGSHSTERGLDEMTAGRINQTGRANGPENEG